MHKCLVLSALSIRLSYKMLIEKDKELYKQGKKLSIRTKVKVKINIKVRFCDFQLLLRSYLIKLNI